MRKFASGIAVTVALSALPLVVVCAQTKDETQTIKVESATSEAAKIEHFKPEQQASKGSVTIGGNVINYDAFAGTLVVHPKDWDDVPQNRDKDDKNQPPEASMFYVAYFKSDSKGAHASADVSLQRRAGFVDGVAAHGGVRAEASGYAG